MGNEYVSFKIASYALVKMLLVLNSAGVYQYAITQEDEDLVIRISVKYLREVNRSTHANYATVNEGAI